MQKLYSYQERMDEMLKLKLKHTKLKQEENAKRPETARENVPGKRMDADDHSEMVPPKGFEFKRETKHPSRGVFGPKACGDNFRRLLECYPVVIDPMNSLAGNWFVWFHDDIIAPPYWNPDFDFSHLHEKQELYAIVHGIGVDNHFLPDMRIGLELGFGGLLDKINYYRDKNPNGDMEFYKALEDVVIGTQSWISKHITKAKEMAKNEENLQLKENLLNIAKMNEKIISEPPTTFYEACQWISWYVMIMISYNCNGAIGAMDDYLYPFYERDIKAGILDEEEAIFHVASMLIKESKYIQLGGTKKDGSDNTNELSYVILEAVHRLKAPSEICVRVHKDMDKEFLKKAVTYLFTDGTGSPNFIGHKGMTEGFMKNGFSVELARSREKCGCNWPAIPGREYTKNDTVKLNFPKILDVALREMTEDKSINNSTLNLWSIFEKHLKETIKVTAEGLDFHMRHMHNVFPELVIDLLCVGTIEKGLDAPNGALEYNNLSIDGSGLATTADSLAAIKMWVEDKKTITWNELIKLLDSNFNDNERMRLKLKSTPSYGDGNTISDEYAINISKKFSEFVKENKSPDGFLLIPGLFSWVSTIAMGKNVGATPNGRYAKEAISFGANPDPGFADVCTPTAMANAVAKVQCGYGNTAPLHLDIDPELGINEEGIQKFICLINTYFEMGGTLLNVNILDEEKILKAHKNPELYPNLIVRITGFSAYFSSLSKEYRQLTVDRIVKG